MKNFYDKFGNKYINDYNFKDTDTLVLSGGAMKCVHFLGALTKIYETNQCFFKNFAGTSSGSMLSILLSVGYTPIEIFKHFLSVDTDLTLFKALELALKNIKILLSKKGLNPNCTFEDIYNITGNKLAFVTTNATKLKEEIFSTYTTPKMEVVEAAKMSASLPIIFAQCKHNGCVYLDGFFFNNFPINIVHYFPNHKKVIAITTFKSHYDSRLLKFYKHPLIYKIILIENEMNKHFFFSKKDKYIMFMIGYNYVHNNIEKIKNKRRNTL